MSETWVVKLIRAQRRKGVGWVASQVLGLFGIEIPASVQIGDNLRVAHRAHGTVISPLATLGSRVTLYHRVTIARADSWVPIGDRRFGAIIVEDDVVLCPGVVILGGERGIVIANGTVVAANAVLNESTGANEIWAGVPARRVGLRRDR